jgi:hypothetical protein
VQSHFCWMKGICGATDFDLMQRRERRKQSPHVSRRAQGIAGLQNVWFNSGLLLTGYVSGACSADLHPKSKELFLYIFQRQRF